MERDPTVSAGEATDGEVIDSEEDAAVPAGNSGSVNGGRGGNGPGTPVSPSGDVDGEEDDDLDFERLRGRRRTDSPPSEGPAGAGGKRRRPVQFWAPFNDWWRAEFERSGRRPEAGAVEAWYAAHAAGCWGPGAPSLEEARTHAKCLRSVGSIRDYFRTYRARKKAKLERRATQASTAADAPAASASTAGGAAGGAKAPAAAPTAAPDPSSVADKLQQQLAALSALLPHLPPQFSSLSSLAQLPAQLDLAAAVNAASAAAGAAGSAPAVAAPGAAPGAGRTPTAAAAAAAGPAPFPTGSLRPQASPQPAAFTKPNTVTTSTEAGVVARPSPTCGGVGARKSPALGSAPSAGASGDQGIASGSGSHGVATNVASGACGARRVSSTGHGHESRPERPGVGERGSGLPHPGPPGPAPMHPAAAAAAMLTQQLLASMPHMDGSAVVHVRPRSSQPGAPTKCAPPTSQQQQPQHNDAGLPGAGNESKLGQQWQPDRGLPPLPRPIAPLKLPQPPPVQPASATGFTELQPPSPQPTPLQPRGLGSEGGLPGMPPPPQQPPAQAMQPASSQPVQAPAAAQALDAHGRGQHNQQHPAQEQQQQHHQGQQQQEQERAVPAATVPQPAQLGVPSLRWLLGQQEDDVAAAVRGLPAEALAGLLVRAVGEAKRRRAAEERLMGEVAAMLEEQGGLHAQLHAQRLETARLYRQLVALRDGRGSSGGGGHWYGGAAAAVAATAPQAPAPGVATAWWGNVQPPPPPAPPTAAAGGLSAQWLGAPRRVSAGIGTGQMVPGGGWLAAPEASLPAVPRVRVAAPVAVAGASAAAPFTVGTGPESAASHAPPASAAARGHMQPHRATHGQQAPALSAMALAAARMGPTGGVAGVAVVPGAVPDLRALAGVPINLHGRPRSVSDGGPHAGRAAHPLLLQLAAAGRVVEAAGAAPPAAAARPV